MNQSNSSKIGIKLIIQIFTYPIEIHQDGGHPLQAKLTHRHWRVVVGGEGLLGGRRGEGRRGAGVGYASAGRIRLWVTSHGLQSFVAWTAHVQRGVGPPATPSGRQRMGL